jgi:DNA-directed RNA polymerase specialized sigma24 family protein
MNDFHRRLEKEIPRLRRYASALTRNEIRTDDLVQDTLTRAIEKEHLWEPGTDLRAWLFTIMHNQNVNLVRRAVREAHREVKLAGSQRSLGSETEPSRPSPPRSCRTPLRRRKPIPGGVPPSNRRHRA